MHRLIIRIPLLLVILSLALGGVVMAQSPDGAVTSLASAIDQRAAANGLPSGDGQISAGEQAVASGIVDEVNSFDSEVAEFEASSPEAEAWTEAVDQRVGAFQQEVGEAAAAPMRDPRAEAISGAVEQYGKDIQELRDSAPRDPRAEAISGAVAQYGLEPVRPAPRDPRAEIVSWAVEQYGKEVAQSQGQSTLSQTDRGRVGRTVRQGASDYIDGSRVKRKNIIRQRINRLIEIAVPSQMLPINGYWRATPFAMSYSGQCKALHGDNDGPSGNPEDDPGQPLCGYENLGALPFIVWNGETQPYLEGTDSIYSQAPDIRLEMQTDANGATIGSTRVEFIREYQVVAPDRIKVRIAMIEEGGCSATGEYYLELVTADESVCAADQQPSTPEPEETPPPPAEGPYRVVALSINDEDQCKDVNTPPALDEFRLLGQPDGSLVIDYGMGTKQVFQRGSNYYEFDSGMSSAVREHLSISVQPEGTGLLSWSMNDRNGNICSTFRDFALPGMEPDVPATSTPAPDEPNTGSTTTGSASDANQMLPIADGRYKVEWTVLEAICPVAMQPLAPSFTEITISHLDAATLVGDYGAGTYTFTDMTGGNFFVVMSATQGDLSTAMSLFSQEPNAAFMSWSASSTADSAKTCAVMANLTLLED